MTATMNGQRREAPNDRRAEEALLGAMLLARQAIETAAEVVRPADFYVPAHVHIYDAILGLYGSGEPVDPITVAAELERAGTLGAAGGAGRLVELQADSGALSNVHRYGRIVEELALLRRLIGVAGEIAEMAYARPQDPRRAADDAEQMIFDLVGHRSDGTMSGARELVEQTLDRIEELYERGDSIVGTPTGFLDLDELLSGLQNGTVTLIGGRTGMGKTVMAVGIAAHITLVARRPVLYCSAEMSRLEIMGRVLASEARIDSTRIRNGKLSQSDWEKIGHTVGRLAEAPLFVDDDPYPTLLDIRAKARRLKAQHGDLGAVIIDHVGLLDGGPDTESETVKLSRISRGCKIMAKELDVPVVPLAQLNRGLEQRSDKRPTLSDLRQSGSLEQDCDVCLLLYRDEVYHRETTDQGIVEVIVAKHRSGPTGVVRLAFLSQYVRFANMARG